MIDSANHFSVRREGELVLVSNILVHDYLRLSKWEALNLAAWLALLADPEGQEFCRLYNDIKKG
jgi:hypothetical protein